MKDWYASRTIWANLLSLIATIATIYGLDLGLDAKTQGTILAGIMSIINILLRLDTKKPIRSVK